MKNGTPETFQLDLLTIHVKSGPGGDQASEVFDSANHLGEHLTGSISPGSSATAEYAYDIPKGNLDKIDIEVIPGLNYTGAHWTGTAK